MMFSWGVKKLRNRFALCVGINEFQNLPASRLNGCVNDAKDMGSILRKHFEFDYDNIVTLIDNQATKKNIMTTLGEMVNAAKSGNHDYLVFSFSSHGTQVPDRNLDEVDRVDEAFCPTDLKQKGDAWDPNHIITDDELHDLFIQLPKKVVLECFFDTCHSGTGLRDIDFLLTRKPRFLPPPTLKAFKRVRGRRMYGIYDELLQDGITHHILWSGCRADQTSADAAIEGSWHGAFTYFFCKEVNASKNTITRKEIMDRVRADLAAAEFPQIPQLDTQATTRKKPFLLK
jgi:hypothetical protein